MNIQTIIKITERLERQKSLIQNGGKKLRDAYEAGGYNMAVEEETETLADVITKIEKTKPIGRVNDYIMNRTLPTLD